MNKFLLNLYFIINPRWWVMNNSYSPNWDKKVNDLLDKYKFEPDGHTNITAKLGDLTIWLGNYPYAYGTLYNTNISLRYTFTISNGPRPSRHTIWRMKRRYKLDMMSQEDARDYKLRKILS